MELVINISKLAERDFLHICKHNDTLYKKCSRYLGFLTTKVRELFLAEGYRQVSTNSSLTKVIFLFSKGGLFRQIKNSLSNISQKPVTASLSVVVENEALVRVEALFKQTGIPKKVVSLVN